MANSLAKQVARRTAELAKQADTLTLVPPDDAEALADALDALAADPARRADLGARGRRFACAHHSWDRIAAALEPILEGRAAVGPGDVA